MGKYIVLFLSIVMLSSCSNPVKYKVSKAYAEAGPKVVAVFLPASGEDVPVKVKEIFRSFSEEEIASKNYLVLPSEEVDKAHASSGENFSAAADALRSDGVLEIRIDKWDEDVFIAYAALKISASFILYSKSGEVLWQARYTTKESDVRLDRTQIELGVVKAYEPRIKRIVEAVFLTLPRVKEEKEEKKYFDWLR